MEFHQLKGPVALAEARSFTRAAQMTHVVQSTLSQQIRNLEEELGVQLVIRTTRKVELTPAGKKAVEYARELLQLREDFIGEMRQESAQQSGVIRIGTEQVVANYDLVSLLEGFRAAHPEAPPPQSLLQRLYAHSVPIRAEAYVSPLLTAGLRDLSQPTEPFQDTDL